MSHSSRVDPHAPIQTHCHLKLEVLSECLQYGAGGGEEPRGRGGRGAREKGMALLFSIKLLYGSMKLVLMLKPRILVKAFKDKDCSMEN